MATQPTQNAVPSESPRDLKFNAGKIDEFVTSLELKYIDRFGGQHYTIEGLRWLIQQAISSMGWVLIDSFQDGADITLPNQALRDEVSGEYYRWDGALPKHVDAGSTPTSSGGIGVGAWVGVGDASLRAYLATVAGAASIGLKPGGNLQQAITWVTPEQFGAIGDGTPHPLSERYATLAAAQAVYPFVTSLTQTIDWAACQAADNYARDRGMVKSPRTAVYHFGSSYLELSINSKWDSGYPVSNDSGQCPRMIRNIESTAPAFGQYCVVRVKNSSAAGSADEFVRGVVFKGFCLTYGLPSRAASKGTQRICLHLNYAIGSEIEVAVKGGEYGVFGYSCWGGRGTLVIDSCHKGFYADPKTATPENPNPPSNTNTSMEYYVKIDACPFGIVMRACLYSKFNGYIEGALIGYANYDSTNETAVAVSLIDCIGIEGNLGVEAWQGAFIYNSGSTADISWSWAAQKHISNSTGKNGPSIPSGSPLFTLPTGNNALFYAVNRGRNVTRNIDGDTSSAPYDSAYICYQDANASNVFINTRIYPGSIKNLCPANWSCVEVIGDPYMQSLLLPGGSDYTYTGNGTCIMTGWQLKAVNGGDGRVALDAPAGFKIIDYTAHTLISTQSQATSAAPVGVVSNTDTQVVLQTPIAAAGFSVSYKLKLKINK